MNTRSIRFSLFFVAVSFTIFSSCSGNKDEAQTESHEGHNKAEHTPGAAGMEAAKPQFQVDQKFQEQLSTVFTSYVELKDAFVASDPNMIESRTLETSSALAKVDTNLLSGAAHNDWTSYLPPLQASLKEIQNSEDIEEQRKSFGTLSDYLFKTIKAFGLGGEEAFYEFCPMAFDNKGAYWLSDSDQIRNPYFGDKMLTCGSVQEKLQ